MKSRVWQPSVPLQRMCSRVQPAASSNFQLWHLQDPPQCLHGGRSPQIPPRQCPAWRDTIIPSWRPSAKLSNKRLTWESNELGWSSGTALQAQPLPAPNSLALPRSLESDLHHGLRLSLCTPAASALGPSRVVSPKKFFVFLTLSWSALCRGTWIDTGKRLKATRKHTAPQTTKLRKVSSAIMD